MTNSERIARLERIVLDVASRAGMVRSLGTMDPAVRRERAEVAELLRDLAGELERAEETAA